MSLTKSKELPAQAIFLLLRHVLEDLKAARVQILGVRVLLKRDELLAHGAYFLKESKALLSGCFGVALGIALDVQDCHADVDVRAHLFLELLTLFLRSLHLQSVLVVHALVLGFAHLDKGHFI